MKRSTEIKIGDIVTYSPKPTKEGQLPMGLSGCLVEAITTDGHARIHWCRGELEENFYAPIDCLTANTEGKGK